MTNNTNNNSDQVDDELYEISLIHDVFGIVGYTNPEISRLEAEKNAKAYLQKFRWSLKRCSKCGNTEIHR